VIARPWSLGLRGLEYWVGLRCGGVGLKKGREEECEIQADVSEKLEVSLKSSDSKKLTFRLCDAATLIHSSATLGAMVGG
jgi:hypothetical protein